VQNYDLEYRRLSQLDFMAYQYRTILGGFFYQSREGFKVRVRARDDADNVQDWGSAPETNYTRTYTWELDGRLRMRVEIH